MAPFIFLKNIVNGKSINVYNKGKMLRDFTYVDDIVNGVIKVCSRNNNNNYIIYNIGNSNPCNLMDFIHTIERTIGKKASINFKPLRKGDVLKTYSDITKIRKDFDYNPKTDLSEGLSKFFNWYNEYEINKIIL
jgi:UDP-glucuronate 4-epimerase